MSDYPQHDEKNPPVVRGKVDTRQGVTGHGVRHVLVISLIGVVVVMVLIGISLSTNR